MKRIKVLNLKMARVVSILAAFALTLTFVDAGSAQKHRAAGCCDPPTVFIEAAVRQPYKRQASKDALKWADAELKKMSLEEKIGQLISVGINARFENQESDEFKELRRQVEQNHVGGIILFRGPIYESVHLVNAMHQVAR